MKRKKLVIDISLSGLFCALICVGAFIKFPIPNLPVTLQVFFVLLSGLILSPKTAFIANFSYLVLGLIGLPLFTGGGGLGYIFIPTFGYILGFNLAAPIIAAIIAISKKNSFWFIFLASMIGIVIIYSVGIPYFALITNVYNKSGKSLWWFIKACVIPFIPKEIIFAFAASAVAYKIRPLMAKIK